MSCRIIASPRGGRCRSWLHGVRCRQFRIQRRQRSLLRRVMFLIQAARRTTLHLIADSLLQPRLVSGGVGERRHALADWASVTVTVGKLGNGLLLVSCAILRGSDSATGVATPIAHAVYVQVVAGVSGAPAGSVLGCVRAPAVLARPSGCRPRQRRRPGFIRDPRGVILEVATVGGTPVGQ